MKISAAAAIVVGMEDTGVALEAVIVVRAAVVEVVVEVDVPPITVEVPPAHQN